MREYIEIPLDTYDYIRDLTNEQTGRLFKAILGYYFNGEEPDFLDSPLLVERFMKFTTSIKTGCEDFLGNKYTELYEDKR